MEYLPILKYIDLAQLWEYSHRDIFEGNVADDASLKVMLRIEKTMQRLNVMGDDDRRLVWIRLKAPHRKADRYGDVDEKGYYWCQLLTAHYKDFHYLLLENPEGWNSFDLRSASNVSDQRGETNEIDVKSALLKLEEYIKAMVDYICDNPEGYNQYVAGHLPYSLRTGKIRRSVLNTILPEMKMFQNREHALDVLYRHVSTPLWHSNIMTLRTYMHVWRIAYDAYRSNGSSHSDSITENLSDEEVFMHHNSKGRGIEDLDLDSEEDFKEWMDANSPYHCLDVVYARISLQPHKKEDFYEDIEITDGGWFFSLGYGVAGYSDDMISILGSLLDNGINVFCNDSDRLLRMAEETDYVGITPNPNKYACDDVIGNEIRLPYEHREEIIEAAEWDPEPQVWPII